MEEIFFLKDKRGKWSELKGFYAIICNQNDKIYIGKAAGKEGFKGRWTGHKSALRGGYHYNDYLQNTYDKYGEETFELKILEIIEDEEIIPERENFWICELLALDRDKGYNFVGPDSLIPRNKKNKKYREPKNRVIFEFLDPLGNYIQVKNLNKFCDENELDTSSMHRVFTGITPSYKGYKSTNPDFHYILETRRIVSPQGELIIFQNTKTFSLEHGISRANLSKVLSGEFAHTKGWHLENMSEEQQKKLDYYLSVEDKKFLYSKPIFKYDSKGFLVTKYQSQLLCSQDLNWDPRKIKKMIFNKNLLDNFYLLNIELSPEEVLEYVKRPV